MATNRPPAEWREQAIAKQRAKIEKQQAVLDEACMQLRDAEHHFDREERTLHLLAADLRRMQDQHAEWLQEEANNAPSEANG